MPNTHISIVGGILVGLLASFVQSLGLTIQRKSHVLNQLLPPAQQRVEHRRPLWLLGFAIFISSNIFGSLVQIASLPVVILAPLGAVSLLWNAFFARLILGDVFSPWMILGTLLIAGGAVLIAVFGIVPEPTRSLEDLLELFSRPAFVAYFSLLGAVVVVCLVLTHIVDYSLSRKLSTIPIALTTPPASTSSTILPAPPAGNPSALTTGVTETVTDAITNTERTPLLIDHKPKRTPSPSPSLKHQAQSHDPKVRAIARTRLLIAISYASFSGIISGMCLLFAKSGVELLLLTLRGQNQFWRWQAWVLLLGLIVFALLQLWYLHKALILADPTLVCPSAFCFYNLSSIVNGLVYFNQFSLIPAVHLVLVIVGIVILLGGVWVVSIQSGSGAEDAGAWSDDEDISLIGDESDEENIIDLDIESQSGQLIDVHDNGTRGRESVRIGPVKMDRMSKSESNVPTLSTPSHDHEEDVETGLGFDFRRRPASTISQSARPPLAPDRDSLIPSTSYSNNDIPLSPSSVRTSTRRRSTLDRHGHNSNHNHSYTRTSTLLVPPQIGAGFQIGLSPVSPGFSILPRRRRVSALGMADVVVDAVAAEDEDERVKQKARERHRRRTVSEGDVRRRALAAERERLGLSGEEGLDSDQEGVASADEEDEINDRGDVQGKGKGRDEDMGRLGRSRWKWLRDTFVGRR